MTEIFKSTRKAIRGSLRRLVRSALILFHEFRWDKHHTDSIDYERFNMWTEAEASEARAEEHWQIAKLYRKQSNRN